MYKISKGRRVKQVNHVKRSYGSVGTVVEVNQFTEDVEVIFDSGEGGKYRPGDLRVVRKFD